MRYHITHTTTYVYGLDVGRCYNLAHMLPRDTQRQSCQHSRVTVEPAAAHSRKHEDYFGNLAFYFGIQKSHSRLDITVESEVEMQGQVAELPPRFGPTCAEVLSQMASRRDVETLLAREYVLDSPMVCSSQALREYAAGILTPERPFLAAVRDLSERVYNEFTYDPSSTTVATPLHEVQQLKRGVCQDFAHFAIGCLRSLGYAARYVSGYLETLPPPGEEKLIGADATHAWFAVYCPGEGWYEFDPTNNKMACEQHIVTAWGRDYSDVTPLRGVIFGGGENPQLTVAVTVKRLS